MAAPGPFFFFPFLIHMYFITPISLQPVSLKEQAKYSSFSGAFTDNLWMTHVIIHWFYMAECTCSETPQRLMLQW